MSASAPSVGITPAQLFTRARDPGAVFAALDAGATGRVSLDDARRAFETLGVKLNHTEARSLLLKQIDGDRSVQTAELQLDYRAFLESAGASSPRSARGVAAPAEPAHAAGVAANIASRMFKERGGVAAEGYKVQLNEAPVVATSRKHIVAKGTVRSCARGGWKGSARRVLGRGGLRGRLLRWFEGRGWASFVPGRGWGGAGDAASSPPSPHFPRLSRRSRRAAA